MHLKIGKLSLDDRRYTELTLKVWAFLVLFSWSNRHVKSGDTINPLTALLGLSEGLMMK